MSLNLANNLFDGEFPLCFERRMIAVLIVHQSGRFSTIIKTYKDIMILDLAWNKFSGRLPIWIGNFANLRVIQLSHNMFTESIPATTTKLQNLSQLNLASNSFSGPLPQNLSNLTGMQTVHSTKPFMYRLPTNSPRPPENHVNLSVIMTGQERYYPIYELNALVNIDLSCNQLTGEIPRETTSLDGIINLNLSWNNLTGIIPGNIGIMKSLESLDLKENNINGHIPRSMSNLSFLGLLDLSHNNLTGRVPSGGQLDTIYMRNPHIYDGNIGLCGYPLHMNCSSNSKPNNHGDHKKDEHDSNLMTFPFGFGVGYVVGLLSVFYVILFKTSWRVTYFYLLDKVQDKVYVFVLVAWARWTQKTAGKNGNGVLTTAGSSTSK